MTARLTEYTKDKLLKTSDFIVDGRLQFDSITIRKEEGGGLRAEFCLASRSLMWILCNEPNFKAGDTLNLTGFNGSVAITLS